MADAAFITETPSRSGYCVLVRVPRSWKPERVDDFPPNVEIRERRTPFLASIYGKGFNNARLQKPDGWWAVPVGNEDAGAKEATDADKREVAEIGGTV
jgi:hypothetical protein